MIPVIALVGRPNVGKSTLFNRLTRSRDALVADQPGLTRDRQYGIGRVGQRSYVIVDTGGLSGDKEGVDRLMEQQARLAIEEADHVLFMLDFQHGSTPVDSTIADSLRRTGKPVTAVVNKAERQSEARANADFFSLGLGQPKAISASQGDHVESLINDVLSGFPRSVSDVEENARDDGIRIAVVGRPNVGKSTLVNRICGEERVLAYDMPGTTRDAVPVPFERQGQAYTLIDTAGVRRRSKVSDVVEKFSVIKTLQAIDASNVVLMVLDAQQGIAEQDATLAGHVLESGRAVVVVVNKWDGLDVDTKERFRYEAERRLGFLDFANWHFVSALHGTAVGDLFPSIHRGYNSAMRDLSTPQLTRLLEDMIMEHQPPLVHGRRIKLRYAHQGGRNPPIIVIHGNQVQRVPAHYQRYLAKRFRSLLNLQGTPVRLEFKGSDNPYAGQKNKLNERQIKKRQRLMKHAKSGKRR
ncbi:MAG: ribosome biogenesis GTPase Der [gamma proteobacterium symbiont of Bathyaustriella thionipta]|nr:ribosome biogenesis GTPase Der [gamma proteobacterium symbiont of Bathyaustriella thionipta]